MHVNNWQKNGRNPHPVEPTPDQPSTETDLQPTEDQPSTSTSGIAPEADTEETEGSYQSNQTLTLIQKMLF